MENIEEKACGCIIIDNGKVLLIQQTQGHWGFPKGHVEENETEVETATREVKEETNIDVEIDENKRYTMEYYTDKGAYKQVVFFIAKKIGGEEKYQEEEIIDMRWVTLEEALKLLTYNNTIELLKEVIEKENL